MHQLIELMLNNCHSVHGAQKVLKKVQLIVPDRSWVGCPPLEETCNALQTIHTGPKSGT